jgi:hypothetical protein
MRCFTRSTSALCFSITLLSTLWLSPLGRCGDEDPCDANEFNGPSQKEYREEYDRDATNQKKQSWDQYWGWVKSFHEGTFFVSGWTDRAKELVDGVKPGPDRKKLVKEVTAFGKDLCKEWAKDSSVCKVGTADLTRWGKMVEKAKKDDAGDGETLGRTIGEIRKEYQKKVNPPEAG